MSLLLSSIRMVGDRAPGAALFVCFKARSTLECTLTCTYRCGNNSANGEYAFKAIKHA